MPKSTKAPSRDAAAQLHAGLEIKMHAQPRKAQPPPREARGARRPALGRTLAWHRQMGPTTSYRPHLKAPLPLSLPKVASLSSIWLRWI